MSRKLLTTGFVLFFATGIAPIDARQIDKITVPDNACGPRCIIHIQSLFGMRLDQEFIDVVRQVQGHDIFKGSSLFALSDRLTSIGLNTMPVKLNWLQELDVPNSATILHVIRGNGEGHFLVREQFGNSIRFWDGLHGYSDGLRPDYTPTGYCLVVSESAITGTCTRRPPIFWCFTTIALATLCLSAITRVSYKKVKL